MNIRLKQSFEIFIQFYNILSMQEVLGFKVSLI